MIDVIVSDLLIQCSQEDIDIAYQLAFLLYEIDNIVVCNTVIGHFPSDLLTPNSPLATVVDILRGKISKELYVYRFFL